jgi:lauroyl/myristoyl acyltransferase
MSIEPQNIINSPFGLNLAYFIGRYTPYRLGHQIADFAADRISARKSWKLVRSARSNQWVVHGENMDKNSLDKHVKDNFRSIASSILDYYHTLNNPAASIRLIEPHPIAIQLVQRPEFSTRGLVLAGLHISNLDIAFQAGGLAGIKALALTLTELDSGYRKQYEMRQKGGMNVIPSSHEAIKRAIEYLEAGGLVMTGIDRPDNNYTYRPMFFGRPAPVPIHHIFLALKAHVPIILAAIYKQSDGKYHFMFSEPIEMQPYADRHQEIMINAESVLHVAEDYIRHDPSQWAMTFPVWPEVMDLVPI